MVAGPKEDSGKEVNGDKASTGAENPPSLPPSEFPGEIEEETSSSTSTSRIPKHEADFRRWKEKWGAIVLLAVLLGISAMAAWLIFQAARSGNREEQKLAFGVIGTLLGLLWSNFARLMELASKR